MPGWRAERSSPSAEGPHLVHLAARLGRREVVDAAAQDFVLGQAQQQAGGRVDGDIAPLVIGDHHRHQARAK
ncbi:MAG TPA: hypothetical protein VHW96_21340 [Solirubrobacteraceae bacterium]|nr:hypothetical protein [Solirubrobacteraceae bacterium]